MAMKEKKKWGGRQKAKINNKSDKHKKKKMLNFQENNSIVHLNILPEQ